MEKELEKIKRECHIVEKVSLDGTKIKDCATVEDFKSVKSPCFYVSSTNEFYKKPGDNWIRLSPKKIMTLDSLKMYIDKKFKEIENYMDEFVGVILEQKEFTLELKKYIDKKMDKSHELNSTVPFGGLKK